MQHKIYRRVIDRDIEEAVKTGRATGRVDIDRAREHHSIAYLFDAHNNRAAQIRAIKLQDFRAMAAKVKVTCGAEVFSEAELQALADGYMQGAIERLKELSE